jgi:hypothetical protein
VRRGIQWTASSGHPRCRESATYVRDPGHCEPPDGRRCNRSMPGCGARSPGIRGSLADRIKGEKKFSCCVTMRGRNFGAFNDLGRSFGLLPALFLRLGMLCSDAFVPATLSLTASRLPAADVPQAFRILAVALVPASWLILASASFAKASPWARSPRSGQTAVSVSTVEAAHGSGNSQGKARGECWSHSPRALSKLEQDACLPVYRLLENKAERRTVSSARREQKPRALLAKRSSSREQDREINGFIQPAGNKSPERCSRNDRKR